MSVYFFNIEFDKLTSLDISNFDTCKTKEMQLMFRGCAFNELDLSHFNTRSLLNMSKIFFQCRNLETVYVTEGKWVINDAVNTTEMFSYTKASWVTYLKPSASN